MHVYHCFLSAREREGKQGYICMFMVRREADGLLEIFILNLSQLKIIEFSLHSPQCECVYSGYPHFLKLFIYYTNHPCPLLRYHRQLMTVFS